MFREIRTGLENAVAAIRMALCFSNPDLPLLGKGDSCCRRTAGFVLEICGEVLLYLPSGGTCEVEVFRVDHIGDGASEVSYWD